VTVPMVRKIALAVFVATFRMLVTVEAVEAEETVNTGEGLIHETKAIRF
jgi:hypothetical protein